MNTSSRPCCTRCGQPLRSGTLGNRCLRCLLELGLTGGADEQTDEPNEREATPEIGGAGQRFGDYELLEEIGRGGMGVVYRARQVSLDRIVALKMLVHRPFETPELAERLEAEAKAAARLHHPGIVAIHEFGQHEGQFFFSMEYIEGRSLADVIAESPGQMTDFERVARYLRDIAGAVHYAHEQGILHRDLKPSNILVEVSDAVRVTDFGLAKRMGTDSGMTLTGQVVGSPSYLSPEQASGRHDQVGPRSDVYALGAVLFELLTGRPPFVAASFEASLIRIREKEAPSPRLLNPRVPRDLETICLKCLEKEPDRRYATARELGEDLGRFLDREPIRARPISPVGRVWRWSRRKPALAGLSFTVLTLLLTILIGLPVALVRISRALEQAEAEGYASRINLAQGALEDGVQGTALRILQACAPEPGRPDQRGWEWHYLQSLCVDDSLEVNRDNPEPIQSIAVSPVTNQFVVTRRQGTIGLWRCDPSLEQIKILRPRVEGLFTFAGFSPQGDRLATCERGAIKIWQLLPEAEVIQTLTNSTWAGWTYAVAFSPDGRRIACQEWAELQLWDLDRPAAPYARIAGRPENYLCRGLAFHPEGQVLAYGRASGQVRIVNVGAGTVVREFPAHTRSVTSLAWSPDGALLATAARGQTEPIKLWDRQSGRLLGQLEGHRDTIQALAFLDHKRLATAGNEQSVRIWDLATRQCTAVLHGSESTIVTLAVLPGGQRVVTGDTQGGVRIWSVLPPAAPDNPAMIPDVSSFELLTEDGQQVVVSDFKGRIAIWETCPPRKVRSLDAELGEGNYRFDVSIERGLAAFSNVSGQIYVWSLEAERTVTNLTYPVPDNPPPMVFFLTGGRRLAAGRISPPAVAVETDTWQAVPSGDPLIQALWRIIRETQSGEMVSYRGEFSHDSQWLFLPDDDGSVHWFDLRTGRKARLREHMSRARDVAISPDDRIMASVGADSRIVFRNIPTRRQVCSWQADDRPIGSAAFSPEGRRFVTAFDQGYGLTIWDWATQRSLITLPCDAERIRGVQFSPDGRRLFARGDNTLFIWSAFAGSGVASGE
ncbi:MAG: protein kinase [Verrucomicrobiales bacterium]|nr:protein kinase [Verrucomicrobiales bacterium]